MMPPLPHSLTPGSRLKAVYLEKLGRNRRFSLRAFAKSLGMSHSHLSRVLSDQNNLSLRQALAVCERLALGPTERREFLEGVTRQLGASITPVEREPREEAFVLELERFKCIAAWYHGAILELTAVRGFRAEYRWIARQLGIRAREVRHAVARLERLGLLEIGAKGWKRRHASLAIPTQHRNEAIRAYHRQMIQKGLDALDAKGARAAEKRDITGTTMAIDPARLPEAKRRIARFRKSLMGFLSSGEPSALFQLNVQLFELAKGDPK